MALSSVLWEKMEKYLGIVLCRVNFIQEIIWLRGDFEVYMELGNCHYLSYCFLKFEEEIEGVNANKQWSKVDCLFSLKKWASW